MKQAITKKLILWFAVALVLSAGVFAVLMSYNEKVSEKANSDLGSLFMTEIMLQMQDHFENILDIKYTEVCHIAEWTVDDEDFRDTLSKAAVSMGFEYVTLYDAEGNYDTILGEVAWYRNLPQYLERVQADEPVVTTGFLTSTGDKYIVFGVPAKYEMASGATSEVMLAGFSVDDLYQRINLETLEQVGSKINMRIILSNGSYVLKTANSEESSFFEYLNNTGRFVGMSNEEGIDYIEKAMAGGENFSGTIYVNGELRHLYGAPAQRPGDWYFVLSTPMGVSDETFIAQNTASTVAFLLAGTVLLLLVLTVFFLYFRLSMQQLSETEMAKAEAEQASHAKSDFLSNMSHDIRTPMNAIVGFTGLALKEKNPDTVQNYLEKIAISSKHLILLINEVLEMSRIESGKVSLDVVPMDLADLCREMETVIGKRAEEQGHILAVDCQVQDRYVYCDKLRIAQLLMNLLGNAIKYTPAGGQIGLHLEQKHCNEKGYGCYEIRVSDNGIGMSEEFSKRAFEPFEREHNSTVSGIEGTGLGLSIVKHIVEMMEGTIELQTKPQKGALFIIHVKLKLAKEDELRKAQEIGEEHQSPGEVAAQEPQTRNGANTTAPTILLVEDNEFNREITQSILEQEGFLVDYAENGAVALEKVKNAEAGYYDMVLMDVQMPVMNGYEATKCIRALGDERAKVRIIAVTANAFDSDRQKSLEAGMDDYISKPIDVEQLKALLRK